MGEERANLERHSGRVVAMESPMRNNIASPISRFEDSPVFNYINNLSPIQPVKSVPVTQTLNSLSFAALPSVFTSPQICSVKESRFLRRHQSDPSKPEFSSVIENKVDTENSVDLLQTFDSDNSVEQSNECAKLPVELSTSAPLVEEVHIEPIDQINKDTEAEECDWENLIFDASDVLNFSSPTGAASLKGPNEELVEPGVRYGHSAINDAVKNQPVGVVGSSEITETENISTQPAEVCGLHETVDDQDQDIFAGILLEDCIAAEPSEKLDDELASNLDRGKRRRCLVFEMGGSRRKHFNDGSTSHAKDPMDSEKHIVPFKPANDSSSRRILSGIGLHLNSLATTSMDQKLVKHETSASGGLKISVPQMNKLSNSSTSEREKVDFVENQVRVLDDASQSSGYVVNEELNRSSPKKKRRRSDNGVESDACKRCNCKKSKCLKLYCECFAAGVYCVEPCSCQDCFNKPIHEDTVLATRKQIESRNPLAFAPKVVRTSDSVLETGDESIKSTPASARHKRGCNCKKGCLKKYCECYQGGVGCSINCRCEGCKNAFGRKDGSTRPYMEEEEINECEKAAGEALLPKNTINETELSTDFAIPATPLQFGRSSIQLPFSSKSKPPRSGLATSSSSSGIFSINRFGKPSLVQTQAKFERPINSVQSDEVPEILRGNGSPNAGVKTSSPNSKRVSPPHCDSSPAQRSTRKLILRSIPSFPSLTDPKH